MSDVYSPPDQPSDDPVAEAAVEEAAPAENPLAAYDAVMGPYLGRLGGVGLVSEHHLLGFARTLRGALMALVTGAELPEPGPAHDAYGDQVRAQKAAAMNAGAGPGPQDEPLTTDDPAADVGLVGNDALPPPPEAVIEEPPPPPEDPVLTSADMAADVEPPIARASSGHAPPALDSSRRSARCWCATQRPTRPGSWRPGG